MNLCLYKATLEKPNKYNIIQTLKYLHVVFAIRDHC